jgi:hypothetical protein
MAFVLSVSSKLYMLYVVILNVIMLCVVMPCPYAECRGAAETKTWLVIILQNILALSLVSPKRWLAEPWVTYPVVLPDIFGFLLPVGDGVLPGVDVVNLFLLRHRRPKNTR